MFDDLYSFSILNTNINAHKHACGVVKANSLFEAIGKATVIADKLYPKGLNDVVVGSIKANGIIDDPKNAIIVKNGN